VNDINGALQMF